MYNIIAATAVLPPARLYPPAKVHQRPSILLSSCVQLTSLTSTRRARPWRCRWQQRETCSRPACRSVRNHIRQSQFNCPLRGRPPFDRVYGTDLPLGEPQVHLATALSLQSRAFLEGAANRTSSYGEVAVVAVIKSQRQSTSSNSNKSFSGSKHT